MSGIVKAKADREKLGPLQRELKRLSDLIESAKQRLESYKFDQAAHDKIKGLLETMTAQKNQLEQELGALKISKRDAAKQLAAVERDLAKATEDLSKITGSRDAKRGEVERLETRVAELKKERADLLSSKSTKHTDTVASITGSAQTLKDELAVLTTTIANSKKEIAGMKSDRVKAATLKADLAAATKRLSSLSAEITQAEGKRKKADKELEDVVSEIAAKRAAFTEECRKKDIALKLREKDLEAREGDVNRKIEWNKKKEGMLRQAKRELEEFRGRPLNHIHIPTDDEI